MADWLIFLFKLGGFGAVLVVGLIVMGKWLLKQIAAALNSYVTAYAQETAKIDARMERLEKLAEEQAHLTRIVEGIKDEIAAQAKERDNRWAFRKEVYVTLITTTARLLRSELSLLTCAENYSQSNDAAVQNRIHEIADEQSKAVNDFITTLPLARLALADSLFAAVPNIKPRMSTVDITRPEAKKELQETIAALDTFLLMLQKAGRKDLWGTPEAEAKDEATALNVQGRL